MRLYRERWTGTENGEIGRRVIRIPSQPHSQTESSGFELLGFQGPRDSTTGVELIIKALTSRLFHYSALRGAREKFQNDSLKEMEVRPRTRIVVYPLRAFMIEGESRAEM